MAHLREYHTVWEKFHGRVVTIEGIKHRLKVETGMQRYPYEAEVITVAAVPVNRNTKYYREIRDILGDDWDTDVLSCDCEDQCAILAQLLPRE